MGRLSPEIQDSFVIDRLGLLPTEYVQSHPPKPDRETTVASEKLSRHNARNFADWRQESLSRNQFLDQSSISKLIDDDTLTELLVERKIYCISDHDRLLYPTYQFDPATRLPYPQIAEMLAMVGSDAGPWEVHGFMELPMTPLDGKRTSEVLYSDDPKPGLKQLERFIERYGDKK